MAANVPVFTLTNGVADGKVDMPGVGIGCWMGEPNGGVRVEKMINIAFKHGYRHIDTAFGYGNEEHVGNAVCEAIRTGIPRKAIFVTTKLVWEHHGDVQGGFDASCEALDIRYVDLYLLHWPQAATPDGKSFIPPGASPTFVEVWAEMVKLLKTGKCRAIGVSNFSIKNLEILLASTKVMPAVNQIEVHPCLPQFELVEYCQSKGIHVTAYSPMGQPTAARPSPLMTDPTIAQIARKHGAQVGQVLVSWLLKRDISAVPKSETEERIKQNTTPIGLDSDDMNALNEIHKKPGMHRSLIDYHKDGHVWGWTYEDLGWKMDHNGIVKD